MGIGFSGYSPLRQVVFCEDWEDEETGATKCACGPPVPADGSKSDLLPRGLETALCGFQRKLRGLRCVFFVFFVVCGVCGGFLCLDFLGGGQGSSGCGSLGCGI